MQRSLSFCFQIDVKKEQYPVSQCNPKTDYNNTWIVCDFEILSDDKSDKGITIKSDNELCIQAAFKHNTYRVMPLSDKDTDFVIPAYTPHKKLDEAEFAIHVGLYAGSDDTTVTAITQHNNTTITKKLNKGEVYVNDKDNVDLIGSSVRSSNPVAIFVSHHYQVPGNKGRHCSGHVSPLPRMGRGRGPGPWPLPPATIQVPSKSSLGMIHIIPPIPFEDPNMEFIVSVTPTSDHTLIQYRNASNHERQTVNIGKSLEIHSKSSLLVSCSSPCLVVQYNKVSSKCDKSLPFMLVIPPTSFYKNRFRWSTGTKVSHHARKQQNNYANIIIKKGLFLFKKYNSIYNFKVFYLFII